jgi:phospholipid/cholesterol/gamma-HCH transport system substrate-binding protein
MSRTFRLGVFIVFTLVILATGIFLIGNRDMLFRPTYHVQASFDNVAGLIQGATVRVGGLQKGTVQGIQLPDRPDGKVLVTLNIDRSTRNIIKKDSVAAIKSEGLLGDKYVEVSFGSPDAPQVKDGELIESQPPLEFADLMKKTDQLLDTAGGAMENVRGATGDLQSIAAKVNGGQGSIGAMVNDKSMYQQATNGMTAFSEDMEAMKHNFLLRGFFRSRGYEDAAELKKNEIAQVPSQQPVKTFEYVPAKLFDKPESAKLKNAKDLDAVGNFLEQNHFGLAVVQTSTGMKGDKDKNLEVSRGQAMVIRNYLAQHFKLDDAHLKTKGLGKRGDEQGKVEILIYDESVQPPKPLPPSRPAGGTSNEARNEK